MVESSVNVLQVHDLALEASLLANKTWPLKIQLKPLPVPKALAADESAAAGSISVRICQHSTIIRHI